MEIENHVISVLSMIELDESDMFGWIYDIKTLCWWALLAFWSFRLYRWNIRELSTTTEPHGDFALHQLHFNLFSLYNFSPWPESYQTPWTYCKSQLLSSFHILAIDSLFSFFRSILAIIVLLLYQYYSAGLE